MQCFMRYIHRVSATATETESGISREFTEKLEYIQELGCNALWINPCFTSPFYDAGYDVEDYYSVAPRYGTNEDLKKLFEAAHQRGGCTYFWIWCRDIPL